MREPNKKEIEMWKKYIKEQVEQETTLMSQANQEESTFSMDVLLEAFKKIPNKPIDFYEASVVSHNAYSKIIQVAVLTSIAGKLTTKWGIDILSLEGMPDDEGLMFKDRTDAYNFVKLAQEYGYEEAKKKMRLIVNIRNLK